MASELSPGTLVDHRYRIERVLGQGGFGRTYLAANTRRFDEPCVLKEFVPSGSGEAVIQKSRELFQREAKTLYRLSHPQIPRFHAQVEEAGRLFLVQDYVQGQTYHQLLRRRLQQGRPFSEADILQWLRDLLPVLGYIHEQGIVHRDISPDNIMLPDRETLPKLIDFGVVKQALSQTGIEDGSQPSLVGKVGYAPTEQFRMGECYPSSDLYALGVTALVLLTGQDPNQLMDAQTLEWRWPSQVPLSDTFVQVLSRMVAEKHIDRYQSAAAVLAELPSLPAAAPLPAAESAIGVAREPDVGPVADPIIADPIITGPMTPAPTVPSPPEALEPGKDPIVAEPMVAEPMVAEPVVAGPMTPAPTVPSPPEALEPGKVSSSGIEAESAVGTHSAPQKTVVRSRGRVALAALVALALLGSGVGLAIRAPHIPFLCKPLDNCARDREFAQLYQQAVTQAESARVLSENPQSLSQLESAQVRLETAIATLGTIPNDTKVYAEVQQTLPDYQQQFDDVQARIEQEGVAQQQIEKSELLAQKAMEQTKTAKAAGTIASYQSAKVSWEKAIASLETVVPTSLVASQAQAQLKTCQQEINAIEKKIATLQAAIEAEAARAKAEAEARAREEAAARQRTSSGRTNSGQSSSGRSRAPASSSRSQPAPSPSNDRPPSGPPIW